jgi:Lamin Tail Domain/FlgD Ig-like domain
METHGSRDGQTRRWIACREIVWIAAFLVVATPARAHTVTVDGNAAEWFGSPLSFADASQLSHDATGHSEYVWKDASQDTPGGLGDVPGLDLTEFRITGDTQRLYFLARLRGPVNMSGGGAPMLEVAIRTDTSSTPRPGAFVDGAATGLPSGASWDRLFETRFGTGSAPRVCSATGPDVACTATAAIGASGVIEGSIPWTALGYPTAPLTPVRFSVALFRSSAADTADALPASPSNAVDVLSDGGAPATLPNTTVSTAGGQLDYAFDVYFNRAGEPYAPLLIDQVSYAQGPTQNWVTLVNVSRSPLLLSNFKVGDAARPGDPAGGMGALPAITLAPGHSIVVAQDGGSFATRYGFRAGAECDGANPATPDLTPCAAWNESPGLLLSTSGDQVVVLDGANTVVDVVVWKHATWPGLVASPGSTGQNVLQRGSLTTITNNGGTDFSSTSGVTPGVVPNTVAGVGGPAVDDLVRTTIAPNPFVGSARLSLRLSTASPTTVSVRVYDVTGRLVRTLLSDQTVAPGNFMLSWSGDDDRGRAVACGAYLFRVTTPGGVSVVRGVRLQ